MDRKITMNFYVERESAIKYSINFIIARALIVSLPLLYFAYIAYSYFSYAEAYYEANSQVVDMQLQISKYEREQKNSRITINDFDTLEMVLKKGFFYDGIAPFSDTIEIAFAPEMKEKLVKFKEGLAESVKKIKTTERAIIEGIFKNIKESGNELKASNLRLDFTSKKIEFQLSCRSKESYLKLVENIKSNGWAGQVFVSSLKTADSDISAYIIITLKEAELFE